MLDDTQEIVGEFVIDGARVGGSHHAAIRNPANGHKVGQVPLAGADELERAVAAARRAFPDWSTAPDTVRKEACLSIAAALGEQAEPLARLLTREQGKPLSGPGSRFELEACQGWAAATAALDLPVEVIQDDEAGRIEVHRRPIGVVASILPWNWPLMIATWHILPAIRAGNTVVAKPSPHTPLSSLAMLSVVADALPPGVLNVVTGDNALGEALTTHPKVDKIVFTGSIATGRKVMAAASADLKRVTLELGGNDPGIVLPDADPEAIAENLFWGSFLNSGQTCACLKRLYLHDSIHDAVVERLVRLAETVPMGDGLDEANVLGPLQNRMQFDVVSELVKDARSRGASILTGGAPTGEGLFYPITLITDATDDMRVVAEEQFGPVLPILRYSDLDDAIARANSGPEGLGASIWTRDRARARELAARLQAGSVWINEHGAVNPMVPFGGVKQSGIGVEFGLDGLKEYTSVQSVFDNRQPA